MSIFEPHQARRHRCQAPLTDPFQARRAHCFHLRACADGNSLSRALTTKGAQPAHTPPSLPHPGPPLRRAKVNSTSPSAHPRWRTRACTPSLTRCPHVNHVCTRRASLPHPCLLAFSHCTVHAFLFGFASHTCLAHSFFSFRGRCCVRKSPSTRSPSTRTPSTTQFTLTA